jgi:hypothetical protein|tara:strand:+ start:296 stop:568 length:273 start_codon:yes stop_codon:yes gene_type:complete
MFPGKSPQNEVFFLPGNSFRHPEIPGNSRNFREIPGTSALTEGNRREQNRTEGSHNAKSWKEAIFEREEGEDGSEEDGQGVNVYETGNGI